MCHISNCTQIKRWVSKHAILTLVQNIVIYKENWVVCYKLSGNYVVLVHGLVNCMYVNRKQMSNMQEGADWILADRYQTYE